MPTEEFLTSLSLCNGDEETLDKDDLLELCFNFVTDDQESDSFQFAHLSVREFLESQEGFDRESCHPLQLSSACAACQLRVLQTDYIPTLKRQSDCRTRV